MKQALETFLPDCGVLPSNIVKLVRDKERRGVVPFELVSIPDCIITKKGNERAMRNFYYCTEPTAMLSQMFLNSFGGQGRHQHRVCCEERPCSKKTSNLVEKLSETKLYLVRYFLFCTTTSFVIQFSRRHRSFQILCE